MKKFISLALLSFIVTCLYSQAPRGFNYQIVDRDASGTDLAFGQENYSENKTQKKNAIHGLLGFWGLGGTVNGAYARLLGENNHRFFKSYWIGVDAGLGALWADTYRYINLDLTALTGSGKSHLEVSAGLATFKAIWSFEHRESGDPRSYWRSYTPSGSLGYRFQKPDGAFIFRTGIGFPDGIYIGVGIRF